MLKLKTTGIQHPNKLIVLTIAFPDVAKLPDNDPYFEVMDRLEDYQFSLKVLRTASGKKTIYRKAYSAAQCEQYKLDMQSLAKDNIINYWVKLDNHRKN